MSIADENPLTLVHVLSNRITRAFHARLGTRFGITLAEWRVLMTIAAEPGIRASEITVLWAMEKMAVNRAIRRLHSDGLIERARDRADGRSYRLELTDEGKALHGKVHPIAIARYKELAAVLNEREHSVLTRSLNKLIGQADLLQASKTTRAQPPDC